MHSDDGRFWWDGTRWVPAYSPDGRYWYDGVRLQPVPGATPSPPQTSAAPARRGLPAWGIALIVVGVLVPALAFGAGIAALVAYGNRDDATWIDDDDLWYAAEAGCEEVTRALEASPGDVAGGNEAIDGLVAQVQGVGQDAIDDDAPVAAWLADWESLKAARAATADGSPFVEPRTSGGDPVSERMIDLSPDACARAVTLATTF